MENHALATGNIILILVLMAIYVAFHRWYGGKRRPLTEAQGRAMLDRAQANRDPNVRNEHPEFRPNIEKLIAADDGREFLMVNLETQNQDPEAKAAAAAYSRTVLPLLLKRGSHPVFVGTRIGPVYGEFGSTIDRVAVVRYRSLYDLLDMISDPAMTAGGRQKFMGLIRTEVMATRPVILAVPARLTVALLLLVLGGLIHVAMHMILE